MAIRINNKDYLNYEEQVLKNKKDVEDINTEISENINPEISGINLALVGKKNRNPNTARIKTFTKDDFVTDGVYSVLSINYGNTSTLEYDSIIVDLEGVGATNGGEVVIESYMDISLQIHNSDLVTDLATPRTSGAYLRVVIDTPIAKKFAMIKGVAFKDLILAGGEYNDLFGDIKAVIMPLITSNGTRKSCDLVIHFSNPVYMIDVSKQE